MNKKNSILAFLKTKKETKKEYVPLANFQLKLILSKGHLAKDLSELAI